MTLDPKLLDELIKECKTPDDLFGPGGLLKELTKRLTERMLEAELTDHLGYGKHEPIGRGSGNRRNGHSKKTVKTDRGEIPLQVPRDRNGSFEPQVVPKGQTRLPGLDEKVLSLYARGLSTREIQGHLEELYQVEVSPSLISTVTDAVAEEVRQWQTRPLEAVYPILYLDALFVKVRDGGLVQTKALYLALGINMAGEKELLGLWMSQTEGAKFWMSVLTELQNRGVRDVLITCVDGLAGFEEAIRSVFPKAVVQLCLVHQVRASLKYVTWKDRKEVAADLRAVYRSLTAREAEAHLEAFSGKWDGRYPMISRSWRANWERLIPFFSFPEEIRRVIYTTNAIESMNRQLRKVLKTRGALPGEEAVLKLVYLVIMRISTRWTMPIREWKGALNRFAIEFEGRIPLS